MESRLLEYMLRVAELGSINKAAADLHLSQPALSRHIAALEAEMGAKLFTRTQSGVQLTDAGLLLTEKARPLLRQFSILKEQVGETAAGQLSVGVPPSWHKVFTTPFIRTLVDQHPDIKLRIHEGVSHLLRDQLLAGILDLCVMPFDASPPAGFRQTALVREPLIVLGNAAEKLTPSEATPIARLDGAKLVLPGRPNALRALVEHMLVRKGMVFRTAIEVGTLSLCMELAEQGMGLTVLPACALNNVARQDAISWSPLRGLALTWALYENQARSHSHALREGKRVMMATLEHAIDTRHWYGLEAMGSLAKKTPSVAPSAAGHAPA